MRIGDAIYLDHHATTPVDARVVSAMIPYLVHGSANPHSTDHALGWEAAQAVERASETVAELIGAEGDEIIFTSGATEANNLAVLGLGRRAAGGKRDRILVSAIEHKCILAASRALSVECGYEIVLLPVDGAGHIEMAALEDALSDGVLLVSVMAVNNEIGTIQKIGEIAERVHQCGAIFHCDAAQAPCAMPLKSAASHCDLISLSGHKMYGPQGIGALFVRRGLHERIEPLIYGGGQQRNLRSGTLPVHLCVGMGAAADLLSGSSTQEEREEIRALRNRFVEDVMKLPWAIEMNGPDDACRHPGNASIRFSNFDAHDILGSLQPRLAASTGSACSSGIPEPSHVLRAIGLSDEEAQSSIRFGIGRGTTEGDIAEAVRQLDSALSRLADAGLACAS